MHAGRETKTEDVAPRSSAPPADRESGARALYVALLMRQERFNEFKRLLALYPRAMPNENLESSGASLIRARLNERIQQWIDGSFAGLDREEVLKWRAALVEERADIALTQR